MKGYRTFILLAGLFTMLFACQPQDVDYEVKTDIEQNKAIVAEALPQTFQFTVAAEGDWRISTEAITKSGDLDWLSISPASGQAGNHKITVRFAPNPTLDFRHARISVGIGKKVFQQIELTQCPRIYLDEDTYCVTLFDAGTLENIMRDVGLKYADVTAIRIIGKMDFRDFDWILWCPVEYLDLQEASIDDGLILMNPKGLGNNSLRFAILPDGMKQVADWAFRDCSALEGIYGKNVTSVGYNAFYNCASLSDVFLPSLEMVNSYAFHKAALNGEIQFGPILKISKDAFRGSRIKEIALPNLEEVPFNCFAECAELTTVSIPKAKIVGERAFEKCSQLRAVDMSGVVEIGTRAFENCSQLQKIDISGIEKIGAGAFSYCTALSEVSPGNVLAKCTSLGGGAFYGTSNLLSLDFPILSEISSYTFDKSGLTTLKFGNLKWIDRYFDSYNNLPFDTPEKINLYIKPAPYPRSDYPLQWWTGDGGKHWRFCGCWFASVQEYK